MTTKKELAEIKREMRVTDAKRLVDRRCYSIFKHNQEKAIEMGRGAEINFTVEDLRTKAHAAVGNPCMWCGKKLTPKSFCFDHGDAVSRGGSFSFQNMDIPCSPCNNTKGSLSMEEFKKLHEFLLTIAPEARANILSRMAIGGQWKR
jgi:hypothetical protein